jgi:hypothetical protein
MRPTAAFGALRMATPSFHLAGFGSRQADKDIWPFVGRSIGSCSSPFTLHTRAHVRLLRLRVPVAILPAR